MAAMDALVFSSAWVAFAAALLSAAVCRALGAPGLGPVLIALGGTFAIYNLDRLRDLARDRGPAPERTAFVERHQPVLTSLALGGMVLAADGAWLAGWRACLPLLAALPLALLHRRLKRIWTLKALYVTAAWVAIVVGVPAVAAGATLSATAWAGALVGLAVFANAIASNVRDEEAAAAVFGGRRALRVARAVAALATAAALFAPPAVRPLGWVGLATLAALLAWRPGERYGLAVVDGALLVGALAALI